MRTKLKNITRVLGCGDAPSVHFTQAHSCFFMPNKMKVKTNKRVFDNLTKSQISLILEICQNPLIAKEIDNCYGTLENFWECDNIKLKNSIEVSRTANYMKGCIELLHNAVNSL